MVLPFDKGQGKINTFIIIYSKQNNQPERSLIIIRKEIKGSDLDLHCNYHGNKWERKLKD